MLFHAFPIQLICHRCGGRMPFSSRPAPAARSTGAAPPSGGAHLGQLAGRSLGSPDWRHGAFYCREQANFLGAHPTSHGDPFSASLHLRNPIPGFHKAGNQGVRPLHGTGGKCSLQAQSWHICGHQAPESQTSSQVTPMPLMV